MSRLLGYMCSDDTLTHCVMDEVADQLNISESGERVGRGFGWLREGRSLLRKQPPQGATGGEMGNLLSDIPAREIVGYECDPESDAVETLDLQPFCFRTWVYAQDGDLTGLEEDGQDEVMFEQLPDHIRRNVQGESIEEICFHVFLDALQDRGGFGLSQSDPEACANALFETFREVEARLAESKSKSSDQLFDTDIVCISDRLMMVATGGDSIHYRQFHGIEEPREESLFAGQSPQIQEHPHFKAVLVTNHIQGETNDWERLPPYSMMWIDSDWEMTTRSFDEFSSAS